MLQCALEHRDDSSWLNVWWQADGDLQLGLWTKHVTCCRNGGEALSTSVGHSWAPGLVKEQFDIIAIHGPCTFDEWELCVAERQEALGTSLRELGNAHRFAEHGGCLLGLLDAVRRDATLEFRQKHL